MRSRICGSAVALLALGLLLPVGGVGGEEAPGAAEPDHDAHHHGPATAEGVELSPELRQLLRREMLEVEAGMRELVPALARGEWASAAEVAGRIEASFVLKQSLTPPLVEEIKGLPEGFRRLDAEFHGRAGALAAAARDHDSVLSAFHVSRLLEACGDCHGRYAAERFPGFSQ